MRPVTIFRNEYMAPDYAAHRVRSMNYTNGSRFVVLCFYSVPVKFVAVWGELIHDGLVT